MKNDVMIFNSKLEKCLRLAFSSASCEKKKQLQDLLGKAAISIEDTLQYPIKIPCYLLMKISKELGTNHAICEIIMAQQFRRSNVR